MNDKEAATAAVNAMSDFLKRIAHPQRLRDVGVPADGLEACAAAILGEPSILTNPRPGDAAEGLKMFQEAW